MRPYALAFFLALATACGAPLRHSPVASVDVPEVGDAPRQPTKHQGTPVAQHGALAVAHGQVVDQNGQPYQLRGVSSHALQWYPQFMNQAAFSEMRDTWGLSVVRAAMYVEEGGYLSNRAVKETVFATVDAAVAAGIYVIIDWHVLSEQSPTVHQAEAKAFFTEVAAKYKGVPNVLYEICNEPNGYATWDNHVRPYAEDVTKAIRDQGSQGIVIVGSPQWSQRPDLAAASPVSSTNVAYTLHFYSATHRQDIRDNMQRALDAGLAIMITEWATSEASGGGGPDEAEADKWFSVINAKKIGWTAWSFSDKSENSALLRPGASPTGPWQISDMTAAGRYVRSKMK